MNKSSSSIVKRFIRFGRTLISSASAERSSFATTAADAATKLSVRCESAASALRRFAIARRKSSTNFSRRLILKDQQGRPLYRPTTEYLIPDTSFCVGAYREADRWVEDLMKRIAERRLVASIDQGKQVGHRSLTAADRRLLGDLKVRWEDDDER